MNGPNPSADVAALQKWIREQAEIKRASAANGGASSSAAPFFNWPQVQARLRHAAKLARVGEDVPPMRRFRGLFQVVARQAARLIVWVARIVTVRQRDCNLQMVETLREIGEGLRNLERRVYRQEDEIRRLNDAVARLGPPAAGPAHFGTERERWKRWAS